MVERFSFPVEDMVVARAENEECMVSEIFADQPRQNIQEIVNIGLETIKEVGFAQGTNSLLFAKLDEGEVVQIEYVVNPRDNSTKFLTFTWGNGRGEPQELVIEVDQADQVCSEKGLHCWPQTFGEDETQVTQLVDKLIQASDRWRQVPNTSKMLLDAPEDFSWVTR